MPSKNKQEYRPRVWVIILILVGLFIISSVVACTVSVFSSQDSGVGNIAIIEVKGPITSSSAVSLFGDQVASADTIIADIVKAESDPSIKAVIFEINSPGGSAVASEEIANAIGTMQKPKVSWIREVGASGAYWIAASTDYIVASNMSITGSVGVMSSYLEFSGIMDDYNISYERIVGGKYKDTGSPFRELKPEERKILQEKTDVVHDYFLNYVQDRRNLSDGERTIISTGEFFLGVEAVELHLVDQSGGKKEVMQYLQNRLNESITPKRYSHSKTLFESLFNMEGLSYAFGKGFSSNLFKEEFLIKA